MIICIFYFYLYKLFNYKYISFSNEIYENLLTDGLYINPVDENIRSTDVEEHELVFYLIKSCKSTDGTEILKKRTYR